MYWIHNIGQESNAGVKNEWSSPPPPLCLHGVYGDNFACGKWDNINISWLVSLRVT